MSKTKAKKQNSEIAISDKLLDKVIYIFGHGYIKNNDKSKKIRLRDIIENYHIEIKKDIDAIHIFNDKFGDCEHLNEMLDDSKTFQKYKYLAAQLEDENEKE